VVTKSHKDDQYSQSEAKARFEAALRGARIAGPKPMKDISPKRAKPQHKRRKK
jgi:hypothetical protein